jgi:hypothetical protein
MPKPTFPRRKHQNLIDEYHNQPRLEHEMPSTSYLIQTLPPNGPTAYPQSWLPAHSSLPVLLSLLFRPQRLPPSLAETLASMYSVSQPTYLPSFLPSFQEDVQHANVSPLTQVVSSQRKTRLLSFIKLIKTELTLSCWCLSLNLKTTLHALRCDGWSLPPWSPSMDLLK